MQPDLRCYHHPERAATGQCDRCGDYLCTNCVCTWAEQQLCPSCLQQLDRPELGERGRKACIANLIGAAFLLFGLFPSYPSTLAIIDVVVRVGICAIALFQAHKARSFADNGARKLLKSIKVTALAGIVAAASALCDMLFFSFTMPVFALAAAPLCLILSIIALTKWNQARRAGVDPTWALIASLIPPALTIGLTALFLLLITSQAIAMLLTNAIG